MAVLIGGIPDETGVFGRVNKRKSDGRLLRQNLPFSFTKIVE
jgi:hypothetical protein